MTMEINGVDVNKFFEKWPKVQSVVIEKNDLTVYFKDSDEPFPYTSLQGNLRHDLFELFAWEVD